MKKTFKYILLLGICVNIYSQSFCLKNRLKINIESNQERKFDCFFSELCYGNSESKIIEIYSNRLFKYPIKLKIISSSKNCYMSFDNKRIENGDSIILEYGKNLKFNYTEFDYSNTLDINNIRDDVEGCELIKEMLINNSYKGFVEMQINYKKSKKIIRLNSFSYSKIIDINVSNGDTITFSNDDFSCNFSKILYFIPTASHGAVIEIYSDKNELLLKKISEYIFEKQEISLNNLKEGLYRLDYFDLQDRFHIYINLK